MFGRISKARSSGPRRPRWRGALLELAVLYVLGNLAATSLVTIVHDITFAIEVVDAGTGAPVPGATLAWRRAGWNGSPTSWEPAGTTGPDGRCGLRAVIQQQPLWAFPELGDFDFRDRALRVTAAGFGDAEIELTVALPGTPLRADRAALRIPLPARGR